MSDGFWYVVQCIVIIHVALIWTGVIAAVAFKIIDRFSKD